MSTRQKFAEMPNAVEWTVAPTKDYYSAVSEVICLAPTAKGALRVAEAEHPGVIWQYPMRLLPQADSPMPVIQDCLACGGKGCPDCHLDGTWCPQCGETDRHAEGCPTVIDENDG